MSGWLRRPTVPVAPDEREDGLTMLCTFAYGIARGRTVLRNRAWTIRYGLVDDDRGEGQVSAATAVLLFVFLGAVLWLGIQAG